MIKAGRRRKKKLTVEKDAIVVSQSIQQHWQRLKAAQAAYEAHTDSQQVSKGTFCSFFKRLEYTYKRIRKRVGKVLDKDYYDYKVACIKELEQLSKQGSIDLYYGDEIGASMAGGYYMYGWQGRTEQVLIAALPLTRKRLNCFGCISRSNQFYHAARTESRDREFVVEQIEAFSQQIAKPTFVVLDNVGRGA